MDTEFIFYQSTSINININTFDHSQLFTISFCGSLGKTRVKTWRMRCWMHCVRTIRPRIRLYRRSLGQSYYIDRRTLQKISRTICSTVHHSKQTGKEDFFGKRLLHLGGDGLDCSTSTISISRKYRRVVVFLLRSRTTLTTSL